MFTQRLSDLRTKAKKTHQDMANMLGISRQAYSFYESGKRQPDFETLQKLADFFDVSVDYLLGRTDVPKQKEGYFAFRDGGDSWTEEEMELARAAVEAHRKAMAKKNKKS